MTSAEEVPMPIVTYCHEKGAPRRVVQRRNTLSYTERPISSNQCLYLDSLLFGVAGLCLWREQSFSFEFPFKSIGIESFQG
mmetsp:Transcript_85978/g.125794  ORF Transcript_85978/g.125794 Transcript_85978/m.125794 type:complete len:81 (-) Transcript_85978:239-481(-)